MNTSPEEQVIDVSFTDVFRDMVRGSPPPLRGLVGFALTRLFKGKQWREATYTVYDLWEKDQNGEWGENLGVVSGSMRGVVISSHQTKVWKFVPVS